MPVDENDPVHSSHQLQELRGVSHGGGITSIMSSDKDVLLRSLHSLLEKYLPEMTNPTASGRDFITDISVAVACLVGKTSLVLESLNNKYLMKYFQSLITTDQHAFNNGLCGCQHLGDSNKFFMIYDIYVINIRNRP